MPSKINLQSKERERVFIYSENTVLSQTALVVGTEHSQPEKVIASLAYFTQIIISWGWG